MGTGSLDVEDMGGLIIRMPRVALLLIVGIFAMFVAPFGMLVSKWAAMEAFITMHSLISPLMIVLLAFGSATTVFFWTKWLGIMIRVSDPLAPRGLDEARVSKAELFAGGFLAIMAVLVCAAVPFISGYAVEPYLMEAYGKAFGLSRSNMIITTLMVVMIVAVPGFFILVTRARKNGLAPAYMSGRTADKGLNFLGAAGKTKALELRSYYLEKFFHEGKIISAGTWAGCLLVLILVGTVLL